ncbi:MAG: exonuclease SbcCD subunit D [Sakamotonia sp.]|jgi:exonuclease SbcD
MKLLHLSDLHIGKRVYEFSMLEDQKYILGEILGIVDRERPDGVLLAGDIYDKTVPSGEAVQVLDGFLTALADRGIPVFLISGNHDSPERIAFGAEIMSGRGVYVSPVYDGTGRSVVMEDQYGPVTIWLLPFLKPAVVRHAFPDQEIGTYEDAVRTAVERLEVDTGTRNVLVSHQFVTGAFRCESEEVSVGGLDQVGVSVFAPFDYVALGHIHSPQHVGRETVRYCGTPLKYSFSEVSQEKSVTMVELFEKGTIKVSQIPLRPLRDMRKLRGTYMEVTSRDFYKEMNTEDYVQITLTDEDDIPEGIRKLRTVYPNLMRLEYDNRRTREDREVEAGSQEKDRTPLELLEEFYELQNNQPMNREQKELAEKTIQKILDGEAEV